MKKKLVVFTSTRAEYGLLAPIIKRIIEQNQIQVLLVVSGTHLRSQDGMTKKEIISDNIPIDSEISILGEDENDSACNQDKIMAKMLILFGEYLADRRPDAVLVLGDRFETLSVCIATTNAGVPIIHMHGGETTEGAIDEVIRHSITKMSYLHLASAELHRNRIIQMGEEPDRVYNVGAVGAENARKLKKYSEEELVEELLSLNPIGNYSSIDECRIRLERSVLNREYALLTYHPVTLENNIDYQIHNLIEVLNRFPNIMFFITRANADLGGKVINEAFENYVRNCDNALLFTSLGMKRYLSTAMYSKFVIGNSSSGIIEIPSLGVPTVNIGNRQKGRLAGETVIHCDNSQKSISMAIDKALSDDFILSCKKSINPYDRENTVEYATDIISDYVLNNKLHKEKVFYDQLDRGCL